MKQAIQVVVVLGSNRYYQTQLEGGVVLVNLVLTLGGSSIRGCFVVLELGEGGGSEWPYPHIEQEEAGLGDMGLIAV